MVNGENIVSYIQDLSIYVYLPMEFVQYVYIHKRVCVFPTKE